ncbi:MAG: O-antigen translocase [Algibacter sp.]|uniref:O-antigen translocase n=1 Tax=Algibacter sp. TaxID=1872428 RepID=UPI00262546DC|nr:O-antigen translocase [Algibacter sp.]MDG1730032.1 O-antigen translocase [Algibacter sp.]MDG2178345.1 O-antigen translocase [Algibacter sp.]
MNFFNRHKDLFLIKLFSVNSLGVLGRSALVIFSQKIVAVFLGPEGMALVGNLKNAMALLGLGASFGVDQGVLNYQSKHEGENQHLKKLYGTSLAFSVIGSIIVFCVLFFGSKFWSNYVFNTAKFDYLFIILSFILPFTAIYNLCFSIISGKSNYKKATIISFTANALSTLLVLLFVFKYQLSGVLLAVTLTPVLQLLSLVVFGRNEIKLLLKSKIQFNKLFRSKLMGFIIMAFVAVVLSNLVDIELRNYLTEEISSQNAGYWTAITSLSTYYLSFMAGIYTLYILPKYAKIESFKAYKLELINIYKIILPIFIIMFLGIYLGRDFIIEILYSKAFSPMKVLFKWQLIGDLVKIVAVVMAYQLVAKNKWKLFILTEFMSYALFYFLGIYFVEKNGVEGIVFAHFVRYLLYLLIIVWSVRYIFKKSDAK